MPGQFDEIVLNRLVDAVRSAPKYRTVSLSLIRQIGRQELNKGRAWKEAVKATKNKLHQSAGAYLSDKPPYDRWLEQLRQAGDPTALRTACLVIMRHHASTRERLPSLGNFYATLFAGLPPVTSVLDLACGLHPLALPWMPLATHATYLACDIYQDQVDFLNAAFPILGIQGRAELCNLLQEAPAQRADVALLLKTIPCLEQADQRVGERLLTAIAAPVLIVSFPAQSLGGRGKGMAPHYAQHFADLVSNRPWRVERFDFPNELVFRIFKG
jgi:16S rRNA (guanine(1405)-N(7))-methyltransferase